MYFHPISTLKIFGCYCPRLCLWRSLQDFEHCRCKSVLAKKYLFVVRDRFAAAKMHFAATVVLSQRALCSDRCTFATCTLQRQVYRTMQVSVSWQLPDVPVDPQGSWPCSCRAWLKALVNIMHSRTTVGCHGNKETLTSPSDSVLCLMRIAHARFLSDTTRCPRVTLESRLLQYRHCFSVVSEFAMRIRYPLCFHITQLGVQVLLTSQPKTVKNI